MDALVIFGATSDLAKLETCPALIGLVERGVLSVPIVGVANSGWDLDRLRDYAAQSLRHNGIDPDAASARRMLGLLRYVDGDLDDPATYIAMSEEISSVRRALFYLEVPPFLFGRIAEGISAAGRADGARVMVDKPVGNEFDGAKALNATMLKYFPRPRGPVRQLDDRAAVQPHPRRERPDHDGKAFDVADRGRFYDRTGAIRDVVQNHMLQVLATAPADPPDGSGLDDSWLDAKGRVVAALRPLTTADVVRGQYEGYHDVDGVDPNSTTESYVAVRLALDTSRWAGVPIVIRAGTTMPVTAAEVSVRFRPRAFDAFGAGSTRIANSLRFRIWPRSTDRPHPGREEAGRSARGRTAGPGLRRARPDRHAPVRPAHRRYPRRSTDALRPAGHGGGRLAGRRPVLGDAVPVHPYPPAAAGAPRRPTLCCPTATLGTTRPAERQSPRSTELLTRSGRRPSHRRLGRARGRRWHPTPDEQEGTSDGNGADGRARHLRRNR